MREEKKQQSLPTKKEKVFKGLMYLENELPPQIDHGSYETNGADIVCSNEKISEMIEKFEKEQVPALLSKHIGGNFICKCSLNKEKG